MKQSCLLSVAQDPADVLDSFQAVSCTRMITPLIQIVWFASYHERYAIQNANQKRLAPR